MPFLFPKVTEFNLYPAIDAVTNETTHHPSVRLIFENFGKTPAILRHVRADLLLIESKGLPSRPPRVDKAPVERGDVIAPGAVGATREWEFERLIDEKEIRALNTEAESTAHSRFYLAGYVVYDDFFGMQHTKRFCLKLRQRGFQRVIGGSRYNSVMRYKAPKEEPRGADTEE